MKAKFTRALTLGLLFSSSFLNAESTVGSSEISASKKEGPLYSVFPNIYSKLNLRQYSTKKKIDSKTGKLTHAPKFQTRAYLGSTFFDGKLDSAFVFGIENEYGKNDNSTLFKDRGTQWQNEFTAYKNDYVSVVPYTYVYFPETTNEEKQSTKVEIGLYTPVKYDMETSAGTFTLEAEAEGSTTIKSRNTDKEKVFLHDRDRRRIKEGTNLANNMNLTDKDKAQFGLDTDSDGNYQVYTQGRCYYTAFSVGASYKSSLVEGLSARFTALYETEYTPVAEFHENDNTITQRSQKGALGLPALDSQFTPNYIFKVAYDFDKVYSIYNEITFYDREQGQQKFSNLVSFTAKVL